MLEHLYNRLKNDPEQWAQFGHFFEEKKVPAKTTLLKEGEVAHCMFYVREGCLRIWFNNDGKDVTFQFFFEHQPVSSFESFWSGQPSLFSIESIEATSLLILRKEGFEKLMETFPDLKDRYFRVLLGRLTNYGKLFLSRIKDNPQKRYEELLKDHPEIIQRVPQHYIASYLGITPISLSRIRNRRPA